MRCFVRSTAGDVGEDIARDVGTTTAMTALRKLLACTTFSVHSDDCTAVRLGAGIGKERPAGDDRTAEVQPISAAAVV